MALWGGRFAGKASPLFKEFNDSLPFDRKLVIDDIGGSLAWARALGRAKVLTKAEVAKVTRALEQILEQDLKGILTETDDEDVHSWVERRLIARVGPLGKKLHTGRSRNDQVATDVRLYARGEIERTQRFLEDAMRSLVALADREFKVATVLPGYTHLQRGQPVLFAHWALAHYEMLRRDHERLADALRRVEISPLGSGALAGTAWPIDRDALARDLGFSAPSRNSLDAVSDRDFVFETLSALALCGLHLSRLGEDLVLYSSSEFGFVQMDDAVTSGSSLMPQKKNPDAMELIRAKSGRLLGNLVRIGTVLKGLPLAYNKDLQEDKEPLFDSFEHLQLALRMIPPCLDTIKVNRDRCRAAADDGLIAATDLADYLVRKGVPFRDAHHLSGQLVRRALELKTSLSDLPLAEMQKIDRRIQRDVYQHLTIESMLLKRNVTGGTAPRQVARQIAAAKKHLKSL
ncbi:MAG: argininosuccinate lyase [Phycisphaerales bacterium]